MLHHATGEASSRSAAPRGWPTPVSRRCSERGDNFWGTDPIFGGGCSLRAPPTRFAFKGSVGDLAIHYTVHGSAAQGRRSDQKRPHVKICGALLRRDATFFASSPALLSFRFLLFISSFLHSRHKAALRPFPRLLFARGPSTRSSNSRSLRPADLHSFFSCLLHSTRRTSLPRALVPAPSHTLREPTTPSCAPSPSPRSPSRHSRSWSPRRPNLAPITRA